VVGVPERGKACQITLKRNAAHARCDVGDTGDFKQAHARLVADANGCAGIGEFRHGIFLMNSIRI
jgi:hypothetical protein